MEKSRLLGTLEKFKDLKIAVIGDMMLDDYIIGTVDRISPEAPVPVVSVKEERFVLGGAANVINNIATLGATTISLGVIGNDSDGDRLLNELKKKGIDVSGIIRTDERPTIVKRRIIGGNQQLLRIDWENIELLKADLEEKVIEIFKNNINEIDAVILSDYDKGVLTPKVAQEIIKISREKNKIVVVDPKPKNALNYIGASSMTPNKKEAIECIGGQKGEKIEVIGRDLRKKLNLENLLLTRSEEGMSLFDESGFETIPTYAKEVYDVTGAGDTVISVYTLAKAAGLSWYDAAKIANTAAGVVVGKMGTSTVTKDEIIEFYNRIYHEWK